MARRTSAQLAFPGVTPRPKLPVVPERVYQARLVQQLEFCGWWVNHVYAMRTDHGWRTGTTAVGFPDLLCLRRGYVLAIEVKGSRTAVRQEQIDWLRKFAEVPTGRAWILRPQDPWDTICSWMRHPADAPRLYGLPPSVAVG